MTNEIRQKPSSYFSTKTEYSAHAESLLALGQKLVDELSIGDSTDTLGRWIAHHIAELMTKAEKASGDEKSAAERECFAAILELWKHRSKFPDGKRPFEKLEPIIRAIESLDPENDTPRYYYRTAHPPKDETMDSPEQEMWLRLVDGIDYTAKVLIGYCLVEAADTALDKSKEWAMLATKIEENNIPETVLSFVSSTAGIYKDTDPTKGISLILNDRIKRLREFLKISESLVNTLEERLQTLPSTDEGSVHEEPLRPDDLSKSCETNEND